MNPVIVGMLFSFVRTLLTASGTAAVVASSSAQTSQVLTGFISALPADKQALAGALLVVATQLWSWWEKHRTLSVPVEDRAV